MKQPKSSRGTEWPVRGPVRVILPTVALVLACLICLDAAAQPSGLTWTREEVIANVPPSIASGRAVNFGDVDGDGDLDIVTAFVQQQWLANTAGQTAIIKVNWYINNGDDSWELGSSPAEWGVPTMNQFDFDDADFTRTDFVTDVHVANLNGGLPDIVFSSCVEGIRWFSQDSAGSWSTVQTILGRSPALAGYHHNVRRIACVDLDGDADIDVAAVRGDGATTTSGPNTTALIGYFYQTGAQVWNWTQLANFTTIDFPITIRAQDVAGNSRPELFVAGRANGTVRWFSQGTNTATDASMNWTISNAVFSGAASFDRPWDIGFADVNADSYTDVIVLDRVSLRAFLNDGTVSTDNFGTSRVIDATRTGNDGDLRDDLYPMFVKGADFDQDGDGDVVVSYHNLTTPADANGQVVLYENTNPATGGWSTAILPQDSNDYGPMNIDLLPARPIVPATPSTAYPDEYPDLVILNRTNRTITMWNQTTYAVAPYVTAMQVMGARKVRITFSRAMHPSDVLTNSYYTASGTGDWGNLAPNPTGVSHVSGNIYELTWSDTGTSLTPGTGGVLRITLSTSMRDNNLDDGKYTRIRQPRFAEATLTDTTDPTAICKDIPITLNATTWTVYAEDIDNGSFDDFDIASYEIQGVPSAAFAPSFTYDCSHLPGRQATLRVTDGSGRSSTCYAWVSISATLQVQVISPALPVTKYELYLGDNLPASLQIQAVCGVSPYAFQWQFSANAGFASPSNINGPFHPMDGSVPVTIGGASPNKTLNFGPMTSPVDGYYRCFVTDSKTPTPSTSASAPTQVSVRSDVTADPATGAGFYHTNDDVVFSVTGHNGYSDAPYTFTWYKTGNPTPITTGGRFVVGGASPSSTLTIDPVQKTDAGSYYCVVTDRVATGSGSTATSDAAAITVLDLFQVSGPLPADALLYGMAQDFEVTATGGDENYTFAWEWDQDGTFGAGEGGALNHNAAHPNSPATFVTVDNSIPGKSRLTLSPIATTSADGYYRCVVGEGGPDADIPSGASRLRKGFQVNATVAKTLPETELPKNYLTPLQLTATAWGGYEPYAYKWELDSGSGFGLLTNGTTTYTRPGRDALEPPGDFTVDVNVTITGATTPVLHIDHPLTGVHEGTYRCTVTDDEYDPLAPEPNNSIIRVTLPISVTPWVAIVRQPVGGEYYNGNQHQLDMSVTGGTPVNYQFSWRIGPTGILNSAVNPLQFIAKSGPYPGGIPTHQSSLIDTTGYSFPNYLGVVSSTDAGNDLSDPAAIVVRDPVSFPDPPQDQAKNVTESVTFTAVAVGGYPGDDGYTYAWTFGGNVLLDGTRPSGAVVSGAQTASLTITNLKMADAGTYEVIAKDDNWPCPTDNDLCLTTHEVVLAMNNDIRVIDDPDSLDVYAGDNVSLSVTADGGVPAQYSYEWYWENALYDTQLTNGSHPSNTGALVDGATTSTLTILNVQTGPAPDTQDSGEYFAIVRDGSGNAPGTSNPATLGVYPPVAIIASPAPQTKYENETATFNVTATGGIRGERSFLWQRDTTGTGSSFVDLANGGVISGATSANLSIASLTLADDGDLFRCVVTAPDSDVATAPENATEESGTALLRVSATLVIQDAPAGRQAYATDPAFDLRVHFKGGMPPYASDWRRAGVNPAILEASAGPGTIVLGNPNVASLTVNPAALTPGVYTYAVQVTDQVKATRSAKGTIEIANKLKLARGLTNAFVHGRQRFNWSIEVSGGLGQPEYQWSKDDGSKIFVPLVNDLTHQGATTATLRFLDVDSDDAGLYQVEVSDDFMEIRSQAELEVGEALPAAGLAGLALLAAASAVMGALRVRRRSEYRELR